MSCAKGKGLYITRIYCSAYHYRVFIGWAVFFIAGSKELSFRALGHLSRSLELRAISNFSILQDGYNGVESILTSDRFRVEDAYELTAPVRKTQPMNHSLKVFEVTDGKTGESFLLSGWQQEELPK